MAEMMIMNTPKNQCLQCKDLPEGKVVSGHDHRVVEAIDRNQMRFNYVVREFMDNGFTEEQACFLVQFLNRFAPVY